RRPLWTSGPTRRTQVVLVEPFRHRLEVGPEPALLLPGALTEEVVERPAQDLAVAVQLGDRYRALALFDRDLGRARQAHAFGHYGLGHPQHLARLADALPHRLIQLHDVVCADLAPPGWCAPTGRIIACSAKGTGRRRRAKDVAVRRSAAGVAADADLRR